MSKMRKFYERYNLNAYEFSKMTHVTVRALMMYGSCKPLDKDVVRQIRKAIRVVEKCNLVRPSGGNEMEIRKYNERFEKMMSK